MSTTAPLDHAPDPTDVPPTTGPGPQGGPRRRGLGTARNMVVSMVVMVLCVFVWLAAVPRVNKVSQPPVDVTAVATMVRKDTGWAISAPQLPAGWRATNVRFVRSTGALMTWHAGYLSPKGSYVSIEQTQGATNLWVEAQSNRGRDDGTQVAGGVTWKKLNRSDKVQRTLVDRGTGPKDLTTIITGTGTFEELGQFADALRPVPAPK